MSTKISAIVVADSVCNGHRITTMKVTMPRFILAEFNTHRMLSKNSASSRAIPFNKMVEMVNTDPFIPIAWQRDHKGMQGTEYFTDPYDIKYLVDSYISARNFAILSAELLYKKGVTKQICNRLLEPFMYHTVLVTATEWENFFHLRCPQYQHEDGHISRSKKDWVDYECDKIGLVRQEGMDFTEIEWLYKNKGQAEIHMMALAEAMWDQMQESKPQELLPGQWHVPFGESINSSDIATLVDELGLDDVGFEMIKVKIATAKAAQTSYTVVGEDGKPSSLEVLLDVHNSLLVRPYTNRKGVVFGVDDPKHMSPAEHCALAHGDGKFYANFRGWQQYRHMIPNENKV